MKTVLVTGGCGFIGSHFIRLLLQQTDWRLINLDKLTYAGSAETLADVTEGPRYRFVRGDIADRALVDELFRQERPWAVVNFAAETHVDRSILDPAPFLHTNILGVQVVLEACRAHGAERFVQISTDEVYGDAEGHPACTEDSALAPSSPYAASKAAADLLCAAYWRTHRLPLVVVRSTNNYGPFQFPEKLIPLIIRNALAGEALPIYGDGLQRRDWLYVEDNVEAIFRVLRSGTPGSTYNVATERERTNREVVETICRLLGELGLRMDDLLARITFTADRPGHDRRYALMASRIRQDLGWSPRVAFEEGLRQTVRWYLAHQEWIARVTSEDYRAYYEAVYARAWGRVP